MIDPEDPEEVLRRAALAGDLAQLRDVLATGVDLEAPDEEGWTALHYAAFDGRTACLEALLAAGASVHSENVGWTALSFAAGRNPENIAIACVRALIAAGADVNHGFGQTPFSIALFWGHRRILKILLRAGADVHTDVFRINPDDDNTHDNTDAWKLVDAIEKVGGWSQYVHRRRATFANVIKKATWNKLPEGINLEIAAFIEPPGGY